MSPTSIWKVMCIGVWALVSLSAHAEKCALPSVDSGEPYTTMADWPQRERRLVLSEYMFLHHWTTHSEAIAAGFRRGDNVYGEALKASASFSAERTAAWRRAYEKSQRKQFVNGLGAKVDMATVDREVVGWMLRVCLANRIWSRLEVIDDCRFAFTAGVVLGDGPRLTLKPRRFEARGARCSRWPQQPLSIKGDSVQCVRSGDGAVTLELTTDRAGLTTQTLAPLTSPPVTAEPVQESRLSAPELELTSLFRSRDYYLRQLGKGCPTCGLYSADLHPSDPNAVILRAVTVSSSGGGWYPCPAGLRCGVYEFSPPDAPLVSGCTGVPVCRIWRLAETGGEASDVIQLITQRSELACLNCPNGLDFPTAHARWQEASERGLKRCEVVAESPAQSIESVPTK